MTRHAHRRARPRPRLPHIGPSAALARARADRWALVLAALVVTLATFLAAATPRLVARTGDDAVHHALQEAGAGADVTLSRTFDENPDEARGLHPRLAADTRDLAAGLQGTLPPALADVLEAPVTTVATLPLLVVEPTTDLPAPVLRTAFLDHAGAPAVTWLAGGPARATLTPADVAAWTDGAPVPVEVGLSQAVAAALGVGVGDTLTTRNDSRTVAVQVTVSGVFRARDPGDPVWSHVPGLLEPRTVGTYLTRQTQLAGLLSDASLPVAAFAMPPGTTRRVVAFPPATDRLGQATVEAVAADVVRLRAAADAPVPGGGSRTQVTTELDTVLRDAAARFGAAVAQASVLLAGVVGVVLLVLVVTAGLLARRRATVLATYRARGATLPGTALDLGVESVLVTALAGTVGVAAAGAVVPGPVAWPWIVPVVLVGVCGPPLLAVHQAARSAAGRRVAANRTDRTTAARDRRAARLAVEAAVVALAVGAVAALRTRGVTGGTDALLAVAPTLVALAGGVVLLRVLPLLLRWGVRAGARSRGAVAVLAAARARAGAGTASFLALALAASLAALGATLATTLRAGEVDASWRAVGADATVTAPADPGLDEVAATLRAHDGVRAALTGRVEDHVDVFGPWGGRLARVVVLPSREFAELLAATPLPDAPGLTVLDAATPDGRPAALLGGRLRADEGTDVEVAWDGGRVTLQAAGTAPALLTAAGDTVVVDTAGLARALGEPVAPDRLWVVGDGAEAAVAATPALAGATVATRGAWLADHRADPLTVGVLRLTTAAGAVLLVLTALVVVLAAAASAPQRSLTLATLRTLGLDGRSARAVTVGELLPGALLASLGGAGVGVLAAAVVTGPLALRLVTGQPTDPVPVPTAWALAAPAVVALTVVAVVPLEALSARRRRLGEVLRIGDARR